MSRWIDFENFPSTATPLSAYNLNTLQDQIQAAIADCWKIVYPVGSIYISTNPNNPETLFGGRWESYGQGEVLVGYKSTDTDFSTIGNEGGAKTVTLTVDQMPKHTHTQNPHGHRMRYNNNTASGTATDGGNSTGSKWKAAGTWIENTTATNQNTGGDQPHNNMPPYIVVYMWRRLADNA